MAEEVQDRRPSPAELNAKRNNDRLARLAEINDTADGQRAADLRDVDGEREAGPFQGGEFDDSEAARTRKAHEADDLARQALLEREELAREEEQREEQRARELQSEGAEEDEPTTRRSRAEPEEDADERVTDGVRYYRTIVNGSEKWLTLKELRTNASVAANAEEALQRAQDALKRAADTELTPKADPGEAPDDTDLENVILSASTGDEEAVKKLASVVRARSKGPTTQDVSRLVAQQIATQRLVEQSEAAAQDVLGNEVLAPEFRRRLAVLGQQRPTTRIEAAYKEIAEQMRKDFAPMLSAPGNGRQPTKEQRKRAIVNPPQSAGRQPRREEDDREVPVSETIDQMARARGQAHAHRIRRS
jgi:hypothetical protein